MASKAKRVKHFQDGFLKFLSEKQVAEVHIYHHVMNYWSNDVSISSLQTLKDAITNLCDKKYVISKNNAHMLIGAQGVPEEDQKNNAICIIQGAGLRYLRGRNIIKTLINAFVLIVILALLIFLWVNRKMIIYFFR